MYLLDTCTFLWLIWDSPQLSELTREQLTDPEVPVYVSSVSIWEATQKHQLGKLRLDGSEAAGAYFVRHRQAHALDALAFAERDAQHLSRLPPLHRDPFDRMLICQAIEHGLTLVTPDAAIHRYPIRTLWH
ncbi:MAG: type II toxin-antitoxin system VapC family toxin [Xanthomonadales bacterium]|jgi:PIN domain nuclease of toxin-antitoxin system|nr:type II toxin-antitoxin system VapC family toxin [Xanthomonadales bacterium]